MKDLKLKGIVKEHIGIGEGNSYRKGLYRNYIIRALLVDLIVLAKVYIGLLYTLKLRAHKTLFRK